MSEYHYTNEEKKTIEAFYNLPIFHMITICGSEYTRVPGGWVYKTNRPASEIFIPYDNEFQHISQRRRYEM